MRLPISTYSGVIEQGSSYRRGLVLGLTMAEQVLLVIFILLLVLGTVLKLKERELASNESARRDLETRLANQEVSYALLEDRFRQALATANVENPDDLFLELRRGSELEAEVDRLKARLTDSEKARAQAESVFTVLEDANLPTDPAKLGKSVAEAQAAQEALKNSGGERLAQVLAENQRLQKEVANKDGQTANLRQRLQSAGAGTDHPPCWATPEGKPEYIFEIALTSQGLIVRDRVLPHRTEEKRQLPLEQITFATELVPQRFLSQTNALYRWSVARECRFFVLAYDLTDPNEKAIYKRHMRTLEQHFYKYELVNEPF
jgi:cell division septum initiation protein DivIVA